MAASTRALTPTHSGPFSAPNRPNTPSRNNTSGATFGTHLTKSPRNLSPRLSPQPLASADDRRQASPNPNPAVAIVQNILGAASPSAHRAKDGQPEPTEMSAPLEKVAKSIIIPNQNQVTGEAIQTSPVSLSSFGSNELTSAATATATATDATAGPLSLSLQAQSQDGAAPPQHQHHHHHHHHHQPIAPNPGDIPGNRAMTFPGPLAPDYDPRAPQRQMSLPGYAQNEHKSPSTKRHKCPYCSTDFTRHHNLKSHLLTHSQEKPYECTTCQARFRRLHDLKRHTKLHTGERPHTCPKCGRRFARGDALARHNKGQGGCAGRRSSFGIDEEMGDGKGEDMDGVVYGDHDAEAEDDEDGDGRRRVSEPARKRQNTGNSTQGSYHQHSSTYPPIGVNRSAVVHNNLRPLYPPASGGPSRDQSTNISPKLAPSSISSVHFSNAGQPNMFAHGGMTESPKPLSPGQADQHRLGAPDGSIGPPPRSPSMSQQIHQNMSRGLGRGSSPTVLAPPPQAGVTHLPSLPGLNPNIAKQGSQAGRANGPSMLNQQVPSQPGSMSSHGTNSVGSTREMGDKNVWVYVRELEGKVATMNKDYEQKMATMAEEMATLRAQLAQQHPAAGPAPGH